MLTDSTRVVSFSSERIRYATLMASAMTVMLFAWWWLARMALPTDPHAAHHARAIATDATSFLGAVAMWQVMMIAMMTPTLVPWVLSLDKLLGGVQQRRGVFSPSATFAAGYFIVWLAYSVVAATAQVLLLQAGLLDVMLRVGPPAGGLVLLVAGLVQVTPAKHACLAHCRSPISYFLARWDDGPPSAFRLGVFHGAFCVACCWALMATAFALGVMNLAWMALLTLILCAEQLAPRGDRLGKLLGLAMAAYGLVLVLR
jgi:predicted metal-binding membrane protein